MEDRTLCAVDFFNEKRRKKINSPSSTAAPSNPGEESSNTSIASKDESADPIDPVDKLSKDDLDLEEERKNCKSFVTSTSSACASRR